jgi:hypothetical protein
MARVETTEVSDSDNEVVSSAKNKSTNGKKVSMAPQDDVSEEQVDDGSDEGSADGSEYEIQSIVSAQRNGTVSFRFSFLDGTANSPSKSRSSLTCADESFASCLAGFLISSQLERIRRGT